MTERIPCKSEGCSATILPATFQKTGGYCMPCVQEKERQERQAYIMQHRKTVDLYAGITDPVEVLKIMHASRPHDPLIVYTPYRSGKEELYRTLSAEDAGRLEAYAVELLQTGDEEACTEILMSLVCYNNRMLRGTGILAELIHREIYDPAFLYKHAPAEIRDLLLEQVESDGENRNLLLLALSWIGDDAVVQRFREWREHAPEWAEELYIAPERYAHEAGWELTAAGERRDLFYPDNYAVEKMNPSAAGAYPVEPAAVFLTGSSQVCEWCGSPLTVLVDIHAGHPSIERMPVTGQRLQVQTCVICSCYGPVYMELDSVQGARWSAFNRKPDYLPDTNPAEESRAYLSAGKHFRIAEKPRNTYHAVQWTMEPWASQIGGYPTWIQDAEYPECPCCSERMHFIGQLDWEAVEDYGEGIYYMFLCPKGRMSATLFQQS
ncbi:MULTISPECIES: DUF1963 domain-containing protein [unclassified Paenibacillus]|uniref:DUF1963 domain-containing protein n=1 Tax=unclassified Paenibacillus TaxID=185978 RepID=UPI002405B40C|nr:MULTISPECIES: DUF1963 domain-containing protein [unclassified Paenibacillus]MDF9842334.1 hypothetical protein [Paenibacillus sp. PastF-2]MDF9848789.1 hypothetical protein [Paenibacillus sp. PastM-2]MDF9855359.1 hypothetical protein [Paenibacillus sp. PastF-1]MDH6480765.1 hypothetical protein [Paenibacillus sp. PastH-2]MDH6508054.1 hypothetical protein [Paenibacillus sp. PastM-3]